jgi:hypothetical protein
MRAAPRLLSATCLAALAAASLPGCRTGEKTRAAPLPVLRDLRTTVVVPTLDTPFPRERNAIWCASFQLAWHRMRLDVIKEPIRVPAAAATAARLNRAGSPEIDLPPGSCYAVAGRTAAGIVPKILRDLRTGFPSAAPPAIRSPGADSLAAYACLEASGRFAAPYYDTREPLRFTSADGASTPVSAFGLPRGDEGAPLELRQQPRLLCVEQDTSVPERLSAFAVELCRTGDVSVVAAVVPRAETLAETLAGLQTRIADGGAHGARDTLETSDVLLVPNLAWRIEHHFSELEGKPTANRAAGALPITLAMQSIAFRLDRCGAELRSEAHLVVEAAMRRSFVFDRPFLLTMQKRGASRPFLAIWVEDAELLSRWSGQRS